MVPKEQRLVKLWHTRLSGVCLPHPSGLQLIACALFGCNTRQQVFITNKISNTWKTSSELGSRRPRQGMCSWKSSGFWSRRRSLVLCGISAKTQRAPVWPLVSGKPCRYSFLGGVGIVVVWWRKSSRPSSPNACLVTVADYIAVVLCMCFVVAARV